VEEFYDQTRTPAAIKVGDTLRLTGPTGRGQRVSPDPEVQIRQTFRNVALTLREANATWSDVVEINSYRVALQSQAL
jgi:enamine deaminase RidA (YjgF/YER057c/UK114 family)